MPSKKKEVWDSITQILASRLPKSEFDIWFSKTSLLDLGRKTAVIRVPNKFVARWLHEEYSAQIRNSFQILLNRSPQIQFSYPSRQHPALSGGPERKVAHSSEPRAHVNPSMTFSNFHQADSNRFAFSSALSIAKELSEGYNLLYIFTDLSLGKTHLLHAIVNYVTQSHPGKTALYLPSTTFIEHFTQLARRTELHGLAREYITSDILLFDDIDKLQQKAFTQEQFISLFNKLYERRSRLVITGTKPPTDLPGLNPRLTSRIGGGILAPITRPDQSTKIDVIRSRLEEDGIALPEDVIFYLARSQPDFKFLATNITKIKALSSINRRKINISTIKTIIEQNPATTSTLDEINTATAAYFRISPSDLLSNTKKRALSYPRHIAMYLTRRHTNSSYKQIGERFGHKHHSSVIYAIRKIQKSKHKDSKVLYDLNRIENIISLTYKGST